MIGIIASYLFTPTSQDPKKEFTKLLNDQNDQKIYQFITKNPQLIHQPLPSGYTPIEHAIALRNPVIIRALIERGAKINAANSQGISPFDQLIFMKDYNLLSKIFSPYFSTQVKEIDSELSNQITNPLFRNEIQGQIKSIYNHALRLSQNFDALFDPQLQSHIEKNNLNEIRACLETAHHQNDHHQIFSAVIYGIMNHKNQVIKLAYELIGEELLSFKTTDLFNLYHIATLFNNANAIALLNKLGLSEYLEKNNETELFSPYYFAIISPELRTFEALIDSKLPFPNSANLQDNFSMTSKDLPRLSPLQLWIAKAHFVDPMPKMTLLEKLNTVLAVTNFALDYFSILPTSIMKDFFFLSYFILQTTNNLSLFNEKQNWIGSLLLSAVALYLQQNGILRNIVGASTLNYLVQITKLISIASLIVKLKEEVKIYSKTFYYRPLQTLKSFSFKLLNHSLNIAFILRYLNNVEAEQPTNEQKSEPSSHDTLLNQKIEEFIKQLQERKTPQKDILDCFGKFNLFNNTSSNSQINYKDPLSCLDYTLATPSNWKEVHRAFRALTTHVHSDICSSDECSIITQAIAQLANDIKRKKLI